MVLLDDSHDRALHGHGVPIWACFMARLNHPLNMRWSGRPLNKLPVEFLRRAAPLWHWAA
jgi:hypothetical protein